MLVQDHLRLVEHLAQPACLGGGRQLPADAAAGDGRQRQDIEAAEFSAGRQLQVPAVDGGGVKSPAIRELAIEFVDDGLRLRGVNPETAAVGENQTLGRCLRLDPHQALHRQPLRRQRRTKRNMRWPDQHHGRCSDAWQPTPFCRFLQMCTLLRRDQSGQQQPPLRLGAVTLQNFTQSAHRPAATG